MDNLRNTLGVLAAWVRQAVVRIALGLADRLTTTDLTRRERAWLAEDVEDDLTAQINDAERRSISAAGARTMRVTRSVLDWLEEGDPAGEGVIDYLERSVLSVDHRNPSDEELLRRDTYLTALGAVGGDVDKALRSWHEWEGSGDPDERRRFLAFQGRTLRAAMEGAKLSIGTAARSSGIDTETLVAIMFGFEELRAEELTGSRPASASICETSTAGFDSSPGAASRVRGST